MNYRNRGDYMKTVNSIIRDNRLRLQYTKAELAEKVGVNASTITRWESGEVANMTRKNMIKLAAALQISPIDLLGKSDDVPDSAPLTPEITLSKNEEELLVLYKKLDSEDKAEIKGEIRGMLKADKYKIKVKKDEAI